MSSADDELTRLKAAVRRWANSKTYEEGCRNWKEIAGMIGDTPSSAKQEKAA